MKNFLTKRAPMLSTFAFLQRTRATRRAIEAYENDDNAGVAFLKSLFDVGSMWGLPLAFVDKCRQEDGPSDD